MIELYPFFQYFAVDNIICRNDGDVSQLFVVMDLLKNRDSNFPANGVYVDIGACVGAWSAVINNFLPESEVHAFEPSKERFETMRKHFEGKPKIKCYEYGIGERVESALLSSSSGTGHIIDDVSKIKQNTYVELVPLQPLELNKPIHIMKIDVDGFELSVLRSLHPYFQRKQIHSVICEWNIFEFDKDDGECIKKSIEELEKMFEYFPIAYCLSRNGVPFVARFTKNDIQKWSENHFKYHLSTDVLFTHQELVAITQVIWEPDSYAA
jgi:FkbM family methyltransferase